MPAPDMLLNAMKLAGYTVEETLGIGHEEMVQDADRAAQCDFTRAEDFFREIAASE